MFQPPEGFLEKPSQGHPLPSPVKLQMERYFGADFSDVRVHVGNEAGSIGALAFTLGSDIYFAREHYQPHTSYGKELLGHELTHKAGRYRYSADRKQCSTFALDVMKAAKVPAVAKGDGLKAAGDV